MLALPLCKVRVGRASLCGTVDWGEEAKGSLCFGLSYVVAGDWQQSAK